MPHNGMIGLAKGTPFQLLTPILPVLSGFKGPFREHLRHCTKVSPRISGQKGAQQRCLSTAPATDGASLQEAEQQSVPSTTGRETPLKDAILRLKCLSLSTTGKGVCKTDSGFVVFVPRAKPGEVLDVQIRKTDKASAEGVKLSTVEESPFAVTPECDHFADCGGCSHQDVEYSKQLQEKHQHVVEALKRIGKVRNAGEIMLDPVPAEQQFGYRNKMTFTVSPREEPVNEQDLAVQPRIGLYSTGTEKEIVEIEDCKLQDETSNQILNWLKPLVPTLQQKGSLKVQRIVIRKGVTEHGAPNDMLLLHTKVPYEIGIADSDQMVKDLYADFVAEARREHPSLGCFFECRETEGRPKAWPRLTCLSGPSYQHIRVNDLPFRVSPLAFFQVNTAQAGKLVDMVYQGAGLKKGETLTDLYCGVGLLGLSCAVMAKRDKQPLKRLRANDIYNKATAMATANAKALGLDKDLGIKKIKAADLEQQTLGVSVRTHVVIVDPARAGLSKQVIHYLLRCQARTVVYVSCDAATQARDIQALCDKNKKDAYRLESAQVLDMFPQTSHVECVAVLRREKVYNPQASEKNTFVKNKAVPQTPSDRLIWADEI